MVKLAENTICVTCALTEKVLERSYDFLYFCTESQRYESRKTVK